MNSNIDILYLGVNMGNCDYRFFCRYPQAMNDYYASFEWLVRINKEYPHLKIAIKHHPGDYFMFKDKDECNITFGTRIKYIDNQLSSYELSINSKMVVSYCSTMILEFRSPNLAKYLWRMKHKRVRIAKKCTGYERLKGLDVPNAYYLDNGLRNRQFCAYIDDVCKHDCSKCANPPYLECYEPYRLGSYKEFKKKVEGII